MTFKIVAFTNKIVAIERFYVRNILRRLKNFRILSHIVPTSILNHSSDILKDCSAITDIQDSSEKGWTTQKI